MKTRDIAFADELVKIAIVGKLIGRVATKPFRMAGRAAVKHPMEALGLGMAVVPAAMASRQAYKETMKHGQGSGFLRAGKDEFGRIRASDSAYANWHGLFPHKPSKKQVRALSKNYDPEMF